MSARQRARFQGKDILGIPKELQKYVKDKETEEEKATKRLIEEKKQQNNSAQLKENEEENEENEVEEDNDDDEDDGKPFTLTTSNAFQFSDSSESNKGSDDERISEGEDTTHVIIPQLTNKNPVKNSKRSDETNQEEEKKMLDDLIEQNKQLQANHFNANFGDQNDLFDEVKFLCLEDIDTKNLDLDNIIRARFGRFNEEGVMNAEAAARGRRGRALLRFNHRPANNRHLPPQLQQRAIVSSSRRYLFGGQKEDWVKQPAFISGGLGMRKILFDANEEDSDSSSEEDEDTERNDPTNEDIQNPPPLLPGTKQIQSNKLASKKKSGSSKNKHGKSKHTSSTKFTKLQQLSSSSRSMFSFEWSKEYVLLHESYEIILQSNDPNYLIMFLVNHPYFITGYYDLALIYIQMGQLDKALELIRRVIYGHECGFIESFKICYGHCYLDPSIKENRVFFHSMIKFAQIIAMQGYYSLAFDIGRMTLAMNPSDDSGHTLLLYFDYYCLMGKRYDIIFNMTGITNYLLQLQRKSSQKEDSRDRKSEEVESVKEFIQFTQSCSDRMDERVLLGLDHWKYSYIIDAEDSAQLSKDDSAAGNETENVRVFSIQYLPNWWFSLALACYFGCEEESKRKQYQKRKENEVLSDSEGEEEEEKVIDLTARDGNPFFTLQHANFFLHQAILSWPHFYLAILKEYNTSLFSTQINAITSHPVFTQFTNSVKLSSESYLQNILSCYLRRMKSIYTNSDVFTWLINTGQQLIGEFRKPIHHPNIDNYLKQRQAFLLNYQLHQSVKDTSIFPFFSLQFQKYGLPNAEDFVEEFQFFPNNLELIQDHLLDINIFNGQMKFPELNRMLKILKKYVQRNQQQRDRLRDERGAVGGAVRNVWSWFFHERGRRRVGQHQLRQVTPWQWVLDLNLPLIQIFFYSLFPWYRVPQVVNNRR